MIVEILLAFYVRIKFAGKTIIPLRNCVYPYIKITDGERSKMYAQFSARSVDGLFFCFFLNSFFEMFFTITFGYQFIGRANVDPNPNAISNPNADY